VLTERCDPAQRGRFQYPSSNIIAIAIIITTIKTNAIHDPRLALAGCPRGSVRGVVGGSQAINCRRWNSPNFYKHRQHQFARAKELIDGRQQHSDSDSRNAAGEPGNAFTQLWGLCLKTTVCAKTLDSA
jgi:hypothetical protein